MEDVATRKQDFGADPLKTRETDHYQKEYVQSFVEKWDELIDWEARAESEGRFFIDMLKARDKIKVLDVATGTGTDTRITAVASLFPVGIAPCCTRQN